MAITVVITTVSYDMVYCVGDGQASAELFNDAVGIIDGIEEFPVTIDGAMVEFNDKIGVAVDATIWLLPVAKKPVEFADTGSMAVDAAVAPVE